MCAAWTFRTFSERTNYAFNPYSNRPLYSNTIIGTLAVDGQTVYIWYSEEGTGRAAREIGLTFAVT